MIGQIITDKNGIPVDSNGNKLSESAYQPSAELKKLYARVQKDYQNAWALQHRGFDAFDGHSLLERTRMDQETFAAFVGAEWVPAHKRWRWKGRKNTARNKIIGILAHMVAGMLYPFVYAKNENDEEDKMTARVMRILVEDQLRNAGYEMEFMFMVLTALTCPAVFCNVEYVEKMQTIKQKMKDGKIEVREVVDQLMSGLKLNILPIDEVLLGDFYTNNMQAQPVAFRVRRISYDTARGIHAGKYFDESGKDLFEYVQAGKTRVVISGADSNETLFDIEWTEADPDFVQELTVFYRSEDLELTYVGGIGMFNEKDVYNNNPFKHRRLCLYQGEWISIPVLPIAKAYFEAADPTGRFAYGKSASNKEYWDDASQNKMHQLLHDGTYLDVIKPIMISGASKVDSIVVAPGAVTGMPSGATVSPYQLGPNLAAATNLMNIEKDDMSESTQDKIMSGNTEKGVTAYATNKAEQNARIVLGNFGLMISNLVKQVGELSMDLIVQHETVGDLDSTVPEALKMKYKTYLAKGKEKGRDVTNRIVFTDKHMGKKYTDDQVKDIEWNLYDKTGKTPKDRLTSEQRLYEVNPYQFARYTYTMYVDPDQIIRKSMGLDRQNKLLSFNILTDPRVAPYTDPKAVVDDFAIEEFGGDDPEKYKRKDTGSPDMVNAMMGMTGGMGGPPVQMPGAGVGAPNSQPDLI